MTSSFNPGDFTAPTAKPLPIILMLDVSGSMHGRKIQALNDAVKDMIGTFCDTEHGEVDIQVAVITFGAEIKLHLPLTTASNITWNILSASGGTPLGMALKMAKAMIEDKNVIPSRAYRPTVILVSDGRPGDSWKDALKAFVTIGRSSKCERMAMAIGADADETVLGQFIEGTQYRLFYAEDAAQLKEFFKFVTMSVTIRHKSHDPNISPTPQSIDVKPTTIESRPERSKEPSVPEQINQKTEEDSESDDSDEGYW